MVGAAMTVGSLRYLVPAAAPLAVLAGSAIQRKTLPCPLPEYRCGEIGNAQAFIQSRAALFDRSWRPRHPLPPAVVGFRRRVMPLVLLFLLAIIGGYVYVTNSDRVRHWAGESLSQLLGGKVEIQRAELSIFEGLRLDGVSLSVDDGHGQRSTLFSAKTFLVHHNPAALLAGRLQVTQIIAIEPTVNLAEDPLTHQWNFQLLHQRQPAASRPPMKFFRTICRPCRK